MPGCGSRSSRCSGPFWQCYPVVCWADSWGDGRLVPPRRGGGEIDSRDVMAKPIHLASGLVLVLAIACAGADDKQAPPSPPNDLTKLRGGWKLTDPSRRTHLYLEFGKETNLEVIHAIVD